MAPSTFDPGQSRVYLSGPVNALVEGIYEQNVPLSRILEHGDFGLGTFNDLDGEMVLLDGQFHRVGGDGSVGTVPMDMLTPFACVTRFRAMSEEELPAAMDYAAFQRWLTTLMPSPNMFYAFRIDGDFARVRTRSVPKQHNYRPLVEVAREQPEFEFTDVSGVLAGFFTPAFMASLNVPGMHLHFLSDDRRSGGHLLACAVNSARARVQYIYTLELALPLSLDYLTWDFARDIGSDLEEAEK